MLDSWSYSSFAKRNTLLDYSLEETYYYTLSADNASHKLFPASQAQTYQELLEPRE